MERSRFHCLKRDFNKTDERLCDRRAGLEWARALSQWTFELVVKLGRFSPQVLVDPIHPQGDAGLRSLEQSELKDFGRFHRTNA